jgi:DNA-binding NarL/FixJ family response regulator
MNTHPPKLQAPLRTLLVEDNSTFANSVMDYLRQMPQVKVVGHATNGPEAIGSYLNLLPQLVLMDIGLQGMTGFQIADLMLGGDRAPSIIFLSMHNEEAYRTKAKKMGAYGFVNKSEFPDALMPLIDQLLG